MYRKKIRPTNTKGKTEFICSWGCYRFESPVVSNSKGNGVGALQVLRRELKNSVHLQTNIEILFLDPKAEIVKASGIPGK